MTQTIPISPQYGNGAFLILSIKWEEPQILPSSNFDKPFYKESGVEISPAELRVLRLIGETDEDIAGKLFISKNTVQTHFKNMLAKTGFKNRVNLVKWAIKRELI